MNIEWTDFQKQEMNFEAEREQIPVDWIIKHRTEMRIEGKDINKLMRKLHLLRADTVETGPDMEAEQNIWNQINAIRDRQAVIRRKFEAKRDKARQELIDSGKHDPFHMTHRRAELMEKYPLLYA